MDCLPMLQLKLFHDAERIELQFTDCASLGAIEAELCNHGIF